MAPVTSGARGHRRWIAAAPLVACLACGAALRVLLLALDLGTTFDSDEAVVGLMARHILEGELPVFFWGQHYMGSAEAFLAAAVFAIGGSSVAALKATVLGLSLGCVVAIYLLASALFDRWTGWIAAALAALPPVFLAVYGLKARGGYVETLLAGTLILWLVARIVTREGGKGTTRRFAALGLLAGLAWWTNALSAVYLLAAAVVLVAWNRRVALRGTAAALPAFAIGSLPFWIHNAANGFPSFGNLRWVGAGEAWGHLAGLVTRAWPVVAGGRGPWADSSFFPRAGVVLLALYAAATVLYAIEVATAARANGRAGRALAIARLQPALVAATLIPLFCFSAYGAEVREPRYLIPLYSFLPLVAAVAIRGLPERLARGLGLGRRPAIAVATGLLALVLALQVYGCFAQDPTLMLPISGGARVERSNARLLDLLRDRGITEIYTDYWICYRVAFESAERVKCATYGEIVLDRYRPYVEAVGASPSPAFVLMGSVAGEFQELLDRRRVRYRKDKIGAYRVFRDIAPLGDIPSLAYPFWETID